MKTWGIRLGAYGRHAEFCERHGIIGIGWEDVPLDLVEKKDHETLRTKYGVSGRAFGTLTRFFDAAIGDYVLYYVPIEKKVKLVRIIGPTEKRNFSPEQNDVDIWFTRKVEPIKSFPRADFDASLKGSLFGYRGSFWCIEGDDKAYSHADLMAQGKDPFRQNDKEIQTAFNHLHELVRQKMNCLDPADFELLVADYIVNMGFRISGTIGGTRATIDIEGVGPFGTICKAQVKHRKDLIGKDEIESYREHAGEYDYFVFASFNGFAPELVDEYADDDEVILLDANSEGLFRLIISQRCSAKILNKLRWY